MFYGRDFVLRMQRWNSFQQNKEEQINTEREFRLLAEYGINVVPHCYVIAAQVLDNGEKKPKLLTVADYVEGKNLKDSTDVPHALITDLLNGLFQYYRESYNKGNLSA